MDGCRMNVMEATEKVENGESPYHWEQEVRNERMEHI